MLLSVTRRNIHISGEALLIGDSAMPRLLYSTCILAWLLLAVFWWNYQTKLYFNPIEPLCFVGMQKSFLKDNWKRNTFQSVFGQNGAKTVAWIVVIYFGNIYSCCSVSKTNEMCIMFRVGVRLVVNSAHLSVYLLQSSQLIEVGKKWPTFHKHFQTKSLECKFRWKLFKCAKSTVSLHYFD